MKLLDLYKSIADTAGWVVSEEGFVSKKIFGKKDTEPVMVKGERLAMPTDAQLKAGPGNRSVKFHPLREDVLKPDTDVLDVLRLAINTRLNITTCWLATHLLVLASSPDEQAKMDPDQHAMLSLVKGVDESTIEDMKKIMGAMKVDAKARTSVNIFTKKGGILDGKKHNCVGVVKFALYQDLKETLDAKGKPEVFGVKLASKKNRDAILAVLKYIYPKIDTPEYYSYGSNSTIAAFMDALMQTTARLASDINTTVDQFAELLDGMADEMRIPGEWAPVFENLGTMLNEIRMVPHQTDRIDDMPQVTAAAQPAKVGLQPSGGTPYVTPQPAKIHTEKGLDFAEFLKNQQQQATRPGQNFGFAPQQQQPAFSQQNHPAFTALGFGQRQAPANPFAEFQTNNQQAGRGSFGNSGGGGGGFGFGGNRGF